MYLANYAVIADCQTSTRALLRPYYTAQLIALTTATELQQLLSALLHTGNQYSVGCCRGRVLYWECET